jgi:hypothetical protein
MAAISRKFVVPALTAGALVLAGTAYGVTEYRNFPGPVTGSYAGGISGTFRYDSVASGGMASAGRGGACLIFRAEDINRGKDVDLDWMAKKHCSADSDCTRTDLTPKVYGYCHMPDHQCWTKPRKPDADQADGLVCKRAIPPLPPLTPGKVEAISVSHADLVKMEIPKTARVRVLTCLNGIPGGGCAQDPKNPQPYRHEWGTFLQLH